MGDSLILELLRALRGDIAGMREELRSQSHRITSLEAKIAGLHFRRFPELTRPVTGRWMASDNFWLQRVCLLFQLLFREKTDAELLFRYIRQVAHSKEFFLQKAAGWALREYSKTDPEAVVQFIQTEILAPLTKREGMKWLKKKMG